MRALFSGQKSLELAKPDYQAKLIEYTKYGPDGLDVKPKNGVRNSSELLVSVANLMT